MKDIVGGITYFWPDLEFNEKEAHNLKIAIIGSRGIPARYGGFETFAEEISTRLASKGYDVYVSCEGGTSPQPGEYNGVKLFYFPLKPFFRIVYETLYDIYSLFVASGRCDNVFVLGYGAGFFFFIPKVFGKKLMVNVDGREWTREKYNALEKNILYWGEISAVHFSDIVVADSMAIDGYISERYGPKKETIFIPYGVDIPGAVPWDSSRLQAVPIANDAFNGLERLGYFLVIARLEPENNIHMIVEGFLRSGIDKKLVIIGSFTSRAYRDRIYAIVEKYGSHDKVIFTGSIYQKDLLNMLRQNCFIYLHAHSAGGTNPSLLEAMAAKALIFAHDNEFNREVGGDNIIYFSDPADLSTKIGRVSSDKGLMDKLKAGVYDRVRLHYSWDDIVKKYDSLLVKMCSK